MDEKNVGVITEQGDLGLGFQELSEEDRKKLKSMQESGDDDNK